MRIGPREGCEVGKVSLQPINILGHSAINQWGNVSFIMPLSLVMNELSAG